MKDCEVCNLNEGKYKCPTCYISYCSVQCCTQHKETPCTPKTTQLTAEDKTGNSPKHEINGQINERYVEYGTEDTVQLESLELLRNDKTLRDILVNPHLKEILRSIDSMKNPREIMEKAMVEPIFREFSDVCLRIVEPRDSSDSE